MTTKTLQTTHSHIACRTSGSYQVTRAASFYGAAFFFAGYFTGGRVYSS
jgi:hypothetical protein